MTITSDSGNNIVKSFIIHELEAMCKQLHYKTQSLYWRTSRIYYGHACKVGLFDWLDYISSLLPFKESVSLSGDTSTIIKAIICFSSRLGSLQFWLAMINFEYNTCTLCLYRPLSQSRSSVRGHPFLGASNKRAKLVVLQIDGLKDQVNKCITVCSYLLINFLCTC